VLGLRHPFTHALYERAGDGLVQVTTTDGVVGLFRPDGRWVSGDLKEADPQLCGWIAGPKLGSQRVQASAPGEA
jgi:hypothetical protein